MREYVIFTDSSCDLPAEMASDLGVKVVQLDVIVDGEEPKANDKVDIPEFYTKLCLSGCEIYLKKLKIDESFFEKSDGECRVYTFDNKFIGNAFVKEYPDGKAIKVKYRFI